MDAAVAFIIFRQAGQLLHHAEDLERLKRAS
jgi:hypothetical protein